MTLPSGYNDIYIPVKQFLLSFRALEDAKYYINKLYHMVDEADIYFYDWRVHWVASCVVLRTSVDLFKADAKSCLCDELRRAIDAEWKAIGRDKQESEIFWNFIRHERDNLVHEYRWGAYQAWLEADGSLSRTPLSVLFVRTEGMKSVLVMGDGPYKGQSCIDLLLDGAAWVERHIYAAINQAGFDPDEERSLSSFAKRPDTPLPSTLLTGLLVSGTDAS